MSAGLVSLIPGSKFFHGDDACVRPKGAWPALTMSEDAARAKGAEPCPSCVGSGHSEPGYGLGVSVMDFEAGDRVEARTSSQWYKGRVDARCVDPDDDPDFDLRLRCEADQGYEFIIELTKAGRTRYVVPHRGLSGNVLEMERF